MTSALLALALTVLPLQEPDGRPELLAAWPELDRGARAAVAKDVERLRKARTTEMAEDAHAALVAAGAGAAPALWRALGKEKREDARERVEAALAGVLAPAHARLVAAEFAHDAAAVRAFALERASAWREPRIAAEAEAALERVRAAKEPDRRERAAAALCATACGSTAGLDVLFDLARDDWKRRGADVRAALETVRGADATAAVARLLEGGDRAATVAGLRLLAGCGDAGARALVRPHLDSSDNSIRVAAINACRGIVDGEPPVDKLPVFEAIERAQAWKERL